MHEVALLPDSDPNIFKFSQWLPIVQNQQSHELWVSFWWTNPNTLKQYIKSHTVKKLVFYDIFHAHPALHLEGIELVAHYQKHIPTVLLTACPGPIPGIDNILHFNFYWNRTKAAYLDKQPIWKQSVAENYNQWPIETARRPGAVLSLYGANNWVIKSNLYQAVKHVSGYHSGQDADTSLPSESNIVDLAKLVATPPAKKYFDNTYISAQVESLCLGPTVLYSEKTYDHLIQGRFVLNFGPRHFYRNLVNDGFRLPEGVDFSWDDLEDYRGDYNRLQTEPRFQAYLRCLLDLSSDMERLHNLFVTNINVFAHNQEQLRQKPYHFISLEQLADK